VEALRTLVEPQFPRTLLRTPSLYFTLVIPLYLSEYSTVLLIYANLLERVWSRDSSGSVALGYGLDDRGSRFRFPVEAGNFSLHHRVQNGSGAHPDSYPMGARSSFLGVKRPGREADH
jgi:hypothetical protein